MPRNRRLLLILCLGAVLMLGIMVTLIHAQSDSLAPAPLNYGDNIPGTLSFTSPRTAYTFVGEQNDLVTVHVSPLASGVDPKVTLLDPSGQVLMQNDNAAFGGKPDAFLSLFLPESGFYTLIVESANGVTGDFLIQLTGRAPVKSHRLEFGVPVEVDVRTDPLPVYFTFKADADCPTTLTVYDISAGQPYTFPFVVIVRDEDGTPVEQLQGGRMTENRMTVHNQPDTSPTAGLYEVEVTSADPTVEGSLFLVVTCADQEPACFVPGGGPEGTPTPATPTPPPPTYDPCDLSEITIPRPEGPVIVSGQESLVQVQQQAGTGGDRGGGTVVPLGDPDGPLGIPSLTPSPTPSPTLPAPVEIAATPCPTEPPCLSPQDAWATDIAATKVALVGTITAGGLSQSEIQATGNAYVATARAQATQVAGEPNPCQPPTETPCPTPDHIRLITPRGATAAAATLQAEGCATPGVTPCPTDESGRIHLSRDQDCATPVVTPCATDGLIRIPSAATAIAETREAEGCPTPTCEPPKRSNTETEIAEATAYARNCQTPTPTPTCPPNAAGAVVPCQPTATPECPPVNPRQNLADAGATANAIRGTEIASGLSQPDMQATNAVVIATLRAYLTQEAASPCGPTATPTCPPPAATVALPCQQTPSPTPTCQQVPGIAVIPCCPTPGAGSIVPENPNQASADGQPSSDLGILVPPTPCPTATATPTPTRRPNIPQTTDCGSFALTSPTDGLPNGGVTVYWNPAPGATGYRVNVFNDANQLKLSVTVGGNVTSVGIDVSEGSIGPGYVFTVQVQAIFNGKVGCTSAKTEQRAAPPGNNGDNNGDHPRPTCSPFTAAKPNC